LFDLGLNKAFGALKVPHAVELARPQAREEKLLVQLAFNELQVELGEPAVAPHFAIELDFERLVATADERLDFRCLKKVEPVGTLRAFVLLEALVFKVLSDF